jgi:ubiquinone/menaquinone biosynthesis C-methylase UbiE
MKILKNWDNNTWLSSKNYILSFYKFLKKEIHIHKNLKILDVGCGR